MRPQDQLQFLQHVAIVIDAGFIKADCGVDPRCFEGVERGDAGAETEVGGAIMADTAAGPRQTVDVRFIQPDAVAKGQARRDHAEPVNILQSRASATTPSIFLLIRGLHEMHVHRYVVLLACGRQRGQGRVRAPVQIGGRKLDLDPSLLIMSA